MNEFDAESLAALDPTMLLESPIVAGVFKAHYRELIYSDPNQAATELDCEPLRLLANVQNLKPPPPSKRLTELCDCYLDEKYDEEIAKDKNKPNEGTLTYDEARNSRTWWDEFVAITKAKTVTDLDRQAFKKYREEIKKNKGNPPSRTQGKSRGLHGVREAKRFRARLEARAV